MPPLHLPAFTADHRDSLPASPTLRATAIAWAGRGTHKEAEVRQPIISFAAAVVLAVVPAVATAQDFRSADARESAEVVTGGAAVGVMNGRNVGSQFGPAEWNLSSPDARDVATHSVATYSPRRLIRPTQAGIHAGNGFDWGDAGIGAAGMLGLVAIVAGACVIAVQRRRHRGLPFATS